METIKYKMQMIFVFTNYNLTRLKSNIEIIQLEKVRFIKVNESKLTQFSFLHYMCVAANASESFCTARLANIERLLLKHSNLSF